MRIYGTNMVNVCDETADLQLFVLLFIWVMVYPHRMTYIVFIRHVKGLMNMIMKLLTRALVQRLNPILYRRHRPYGNKPLH